MKVLVNKTYSFVHLVWTTYIAENKVDIRYLYNVVLSTLAV